MDEGARQEFAEFAAARLTRLIRLAYVLAGDQHAAENLLQKALVKAAAHTGRKHHRAGSVRAPDHVLRAGQLAAPPRQAAGDRDGPCARAAR